MQEDAKSDRKIGYVIILLLCAWTGGFYVGEHTSSRQTKALTSDTVVVVHHDTIVSYEPFEVIRCVYNTRIDTLRAIDSVFVAVEIPIESAQFSDTFTTENDTICYNAFLSGYKPKLDSLQLFCNSYERTVIQTIPQKQKRWHWGVSGGYFVGYDLTSGKFGNGLGICVGGCYNF